MKPITHTLSFLLCAALGCATVTVDEPPGTELPDGTGGSNLGDGDGDETGSGGLVGVGGGGLVGDGDGDGTGGLLVGDGDGDGDAAGGTPGTGGAPSSCGTCKAWSEYGYHTPPPPTPGTSCVTGTDTNDYLFVSGTYNTACGPPGEREGWCAATDGLFELCD